MSRDPPDLGGEASREGGGGGERLRELLGRIVGETPVARQASRVGDNLGLVFVAVVFGHHRAKPKGQDMCHFGAVVLFATSRPF